MTPNFQWAWLVSFHTLPDGPEKVIAYASCKLSPAKKKYVQI